MVNSGDDFNVTETGIVILICWWFCDSVSLIWWFWSGDDEGGIELFSCGRRTLISGGHWRQGHMMVRLFYLVTILTLASITLNKVMMLMASLVQMCKNARMQQLQEWLGLKLQQKRNPCFKKVTLPAVCKALHLRWTCSAWRIMPECQVSEWSHLTLGKRTSNTHTQLRVRVSVQVRARVFTHTATCTSKCTCMCTCMCTSNTHTTTCTSICTFTYTSKTHTQLVNLRPWWSRGPDFASWNCRF